MNTPALSPTTEASQNLDKLFANDYPGRLAFIGTTRDSECLLLLYVLTGRSEDSQSRRIIINRKGHLKTVMACGKKATDPKLTIYDITRQNSPAGVFVVGNGRQVHDCGRWTRGFRDMKRPLQTILRRGGWKYEPDSNHTSRITAAAVITDNGVIGHFNFLEHAGKNGNCRSRNYPNVVIPNGFGYAIMTYEGNGNPLPRFSGPPMLLPVFCNSAEGNAEAYWQILPEDKRVALAARMIHIETRHCQTFRINTHKR